MTSNSRQFAFIVHPRNLSDVQRKYPILRIFPNPIQCGILSLLPPVKVGEISAPGGVRGHIIAIPLVGHQILHNKTLAKRKIINALKLAKKHGASIVGLGSLTAPAVGGGEEIVGKIKDIAITNGNALTASATLEAIKQLLIKHNLDIKTVNFAVIGATGSIGSAVAQLLAESGATSMILIGRTPEHLNELKKNLLARHPRLADIRTSRDITAVGKAEFLVVATSAVGAIIQPEHLGRNAIVYDVTQPQNVRADVVETRPDVLVVDGGLVYFPGLTFTFDLGLPENTCFACIAETALLAKEGRIKNYSIGKVSPQKAHEMWSIAMRHGVKLAPFRTFGKLISPKH